MSRVILMCGPAGSGKSTVARTLELEGYERLSVDTVAWDRGIAATLCLNHLRRTSAPRSRIAWSNSCAKALTWFDLIISGEAASTQTEACSDSSRKGAGDRFQRQR
jgi:cytidylate kinase